LQQLEDLNQGYQSTDQPNALQVIVPSRLPFYPPFFSPHPYRGPHHLELITPGTPSHSMQSDHSQGHLIKSDGTIRIPRHRAPLFSPMMISEVLRHTSLSDPKDLHIILRLEQERDHVKATIVLEIGLEGSLPHIVIHHNT